MSHPIGDRFEAERVPSRVVRVTEDIAAPPESVFRALVDPRELTAWLGSDDVRDDSKRAAEPAPPVPGRAWRAPVLAPDGTPGFVSGEYVLVDPPRRLETTWRTDWTGAAPERVRFELVPIEVGGQRGTRITVTHTRADLRVHTTVSTVTRASAGVEDDLWPTLLARLVAYVTTVDALARWSDSSSGDLAHAFDALHRRVVAIHQGESA
jgi:uncharacterized protein YndB with AHSA1/START domain